MNLAALWSLPVLFVCENNRYAMGTALERSESVTAIRDKAASYGMEAKVVDGMEVVAIEAAARRAVAAIREQRRPIFLECHTYRFRAHSMFDAQLYRDKAEIESWRHKGPIVRFQGRLLENGLIHEDEIATVISEIDAEIVEAVAFAEAAPWEPVEEMTRHVTAETRPLAPKPVAPGDETNENKYREAVKQAIRDAMTRDPRVFLMGEDVGAYGGCYAVSKGLMAEFGPERIRDTPLSSPASPALVSGRRRPACGRSSS